MGKMNNLLDELLSATEDFHNANYDEEYHAAQKRMHEARTTLEAYILRVLEENAVLEKHCLVCEQCQDALQIAYQYGGIDGGHHKTWVIDQMVRALTGDDYEEWVHNYKDGEDGPNSYGWDEGIAP